MSDWVIEPLKILKPKFWRSINVAVLLALLSSSGVAHAESRVDCSEIKSAILKRAVAYCVMLPPSYDADQTRHYPILYYLHGLGDNEQSMVNAGGWNQYEDLLESKKVGEFLVVTPNGFRSFYINSRDGKFRYEDFFLKEFIPAIEKKYRVKAGRASHGIMGISMGGYGAFHYAFKFPQMFTSVSAQMAALRESVPPDMAEARDRQIMGDIFGSPFDAAYYRQNSPFTLAAKAPLPLLQGLHIYFDVGRDDNYGFNVGGEDLHKLLDRRKIKNEFRIFPGSHNLMYAMEHFEASLIMHSKAFGLTK